MLSTRKRHVCLCMFTCLLKEMADGFKHDMYSIGSKIVNFRHFLIL